MTYRTLSLTAVLAAALVAGPAAYAQEKSSSKGLFGFTSALDTLDERAGKKDRRLAQNEDQTTNDGKKRKKKRRRGSYK